MPTIHPVIIIGAGPIGLAAAAHLIEYGTQPLILEAGEEVGHNIASWGHVRMFSPWEYTVDAAMVRLLEASGWQMPPKEALPTGADLVERFLRPFANLPIIKPFIRTGQRVIGISRQHADKMKDRQRDERVFIMQIQDAEGKQHIERAHAIIDASGTWHNPNPLGAHGLRAQGEAENDAHIQYGIPDILGTQRARYANQRVLVVGSGHSAINALLDLGKLRASHSQTQIYWALRGSNMTRVLGGGEDDALPARGALGTRLRTLMQDGTLTILSPFYLTAIQRTDDGLRVSGSDESVQAVIVDEIIGATGARPDLGMLREVRIELDPSLETTPALAPMIDPNIHSCGTVRPHGEAELRHPEANFYIIGMKSYGRAPSFLLATGYEQARSVVAHLMGDYAAAKDVQLVLPETGVCSSDFSDDAACCSTIDDRDEQVQIIPLTTVGTTTSCC